VSENLPVSFSNTRQGGLHSYVSIPHKTEYWGGFWVPVAFFKHDSFLGAFAKLRKANITFRPCPSVRHGPTRLALDGFS